MLGINIIPEKYKIPAKKKKKIIIIFGNCHFQEIQRNIIQYQEIKKNYLPHYICINSYVGEGSLKDKQYFTTEHITLFEKADILIYQNIETDRGFLNNKEVEKLIPKNIIKIKIPHYRTSIYHYSWYETPYFEKMKKLVDKKETVNQKITCIKDFIKNINDTSQHKELFDKFITKEITHFKKVNNYSDIDMYEFFISNWKNIKLFMGRSYPSSYFIFILTKKILEKINVFENMSFETMINNRTTYPRYFAQNTDYPIFDFWYNFNKFTFNNQYFWEMEIPMKDYEFYYLQYLICNKHGNNCSFANIWMIRDKFNTLEELKKLRDVINNT
tara:strand:- start:80 stop:1066 length:987 start_codon:yes stop_codon:yes gene_type:complete